MAFTRPVPSYDDRACFSFTLWVLASNEDPSSAEQLCKALKTTECLDVLQKTPGIVHSLFAACNTVQKCEIIVTAGFGFDKQMAESALSQAKTNNRPLLIAYWERALKSMEPTAETMLDAM